MRSLLFLPLLLFSGPTARPFWPDWNILTHMADVAHVPHGPVAAIAWLETRDNMDSAVRGHHCWHDRGERVSAMDTVHWATSVHTPNCEVGRFQIKPSTARARCPNLDIFTRQGNYICFFWMFHQDFDRYGAMEAIKRHHGGTPQQNAAYFREALKVIALVALTETWTPQVCRVQSEAE